MKFHITALQFAESPNLILLQKRVFEGVTAASSSALVSAFNKHLKN